MDEDKIAPGRPGIEPRWTSSAKNGIGTACSSTSRVWFTLSHGILNEVYYPDVDQACIRDLGLLITDGRDFFSDEKRQTHSQIDYLSSGVPAFRLVNTCLSGRYRVEKEIFADPDRNAILQRIQFVPLVGSLRDYHLYALLAPHIRNRGMGNSAWIGEFNGLPLLFAQRDDTALAFVCSVPWGKKSAGYVGYSDGWQDVMSHKQMTWKYTRAEEGNVALIGEIDLVQSNGIFVLALGFGQSAAEAAQQASASLSQDFETLLGKYREEWQTWQKSLSTILDKPNDTQNVYRQSMSILRSSVSKAHPGGLIASLSIPWGFSKGDDDLGGYHLVWTRDLVETAGALIAAGANESVLRVLHYLAATQLPDGNWSQNMWIDGSPYWSGIQMDETAFPILLVDMAYRNTVIDVRGLAPFWRTVRKAACYIAVNGPVTQQDRWEEDPGYSPFTLAVEIAGLLAAADIADLNNDAAFGAYLRETADHWNSSIERWMYVTNTSLARQVGVEGYYVRVAPPDVGEAASPAQGFVPIKNRPPGESSEPATHIISPDALALVRFGLRSANDPRITNTVRVIDALLKIETKFGPLWHRYNDDGYGEHEDGSPFDGTGVGRAWPLLVGERAHFELAAGRPSEAAKLLKTLESCANDGGMIPEQMWDAPDIPERELFFGKPSGSAMPLVWAHAEYVKLLRSLHDGRVFDMPPQTVERYVDSKHDSPYAIWRFNHKCTSIPAGKTLRIELLAPATVHWSPDDWQTVNDTATRDLGFGLHLAELSTDKLSDGSVVRFTFLWESTRAWEGTDFAVSVV